MLPAPCGSRGTQCRSPRHAVCSAPLDPPRKEVISFMDYVLFLDDDHARHAAFRARIEVLGYARKRKLLYVFSAAEAVAALRTHEGEIGEAFLDHDLCEDDQWVTPGRPSKLPTGMVVVDHIVTMHRPPPVITVHSFN